MTKTAIVIGASHAGAQLVTSLRQTGWAGEIILVGEEPQLPYQRPPLSKTFLAGDKTADELLIRPAAFYEKQAIVCRHGRVTAIDRTSQTITLSDGDVLAYDALALCLGARARPVTLPGSDLAGVHYLRSMADVDGIRAELNHAKTAVIIGGGYIGLETAASLRKQGVEVVVLEMAERILQRVTAPEMSAFYTRVHAEEGVAIHTSISVASLLGDKQVTGVSCSDGQVFPADIVVIGVGVIANVELAEAAGLTVDNGIVVDEFCRTNDPLIVAAGDCTSQFNTRYQRRIRLESVPNAGEQGKTAAATLCGQPKSHAGLPWFWSDQYDVKLQIAGLSQGYDALVIRGDIRAGRSFAAFYLKAGQLIAADCINRPQEFMLAKRLIAEGLSVDAADLSNEDIAVKDLAATN